MYELLIEAPLYKYVMVCYQILHQFLVRKEQANIGEKGCSMGRPAAWEGPARR